MRSTEGQDADRNFEKAAQPYMEVVAEMNPLVAASNITNGITTGNNIFGREMSSGDYVSSGLGLVGGVAFKAAAKIFTGASLCPIIARGAKAVGKSLNQLNKLIKIGKAPKTIVRFDKGKIFGELDHVHFENGSALNIDGTWKHGSKILTNSEIKFLQENGWTLPK